MREMYALIVISSIIQIGHSHLVVSFGGNAQKNGIALDKESNDGELGTNSMTALC